MKLFIKNNGFFISALIALFFIYGFHEILFLRPQSMHQWRQADCLQITHNYLTESWNFFSPSIHNYFSDNETSGKTIGEFPLLYYFVAILWKVFGEHEFIFRLVNLSLFFVGLFALYETLKQLLNNTFWPTIITLFLFTSPILIFYSNNFLTNTPAFGFVLIGWYYFYRYYQSKAMRLMFLSILFFTLAGLLKMTAYISFVLLSFFYIIDLFRSLILKRPAVIYTLKKSLLLCFILGPLTLFSWYAYAAYFTKIHGGKYTFNGLWPIWEMQEGQLEGIKKFVNEILIHQVFSKYSLILIALFFILLFVDYKKLNKFILASLILLPIGVSVFILFWFQALDAHDYYVINLIILPLFILVSFIWHLKTNYPQFLASKMVKSFFLILLLFNIIYATNNIKMRYWGHFNYSDKVANYLCDKPEVGFWWWTGSQNSFESLNDIEQYNRSLGINKSDLVAYIPDQGFATSLYLMNQKGWTSGFGIENDPNMAPENKLKDKIENKHLKYLFVGDSTSLTKEYLKPFLTKPIGNYKGVFVFSVATNE